MHLKVRSCLRVDAFVMTYAPTKITHILPGQQKQLLKICVGPTLTRGQRTISVLSLDLTEIKSNRDSGVVHDTKQATATSGVIRAAGCG